MLTLRQLRHLLPTIAVSLAAVCLTAPAQAATPGVLDASWGGAGIVVTPLDPVSESGEATLVLPNGKVLVAADWIVGPNVAIVRYNADGTLDTTFGGGDGIATTPISTLGHIPIVRDIALDSLGRIVVGGADGSIAGLMAARFLADGTVDTSFNAGAVAPGVPGTVTFTIGAPATYDQYEAFAVVIRSDNSIVLAGSARKPAGPDFDAIVASVTAAGVPGGYNGPVAVGTNEVFRDAVLVGSTIVAVGSIGNQIPTTWDDVTRDSLIVRFNAPTLGNQGVTTDDLSTIGVDDALSAVAAQSDGRVVVAGFAKAGGLHRAVLVERYHFSPSFQLDGSIASPITNFSMTYDQMAKSVALDPFGRIVVAGWMYNPLKPTLIARFTAAGALDTTFAAPAGFTTIAMYQVDPFSNLRDTQVALQSDGKLLVAAHHLASASHLAAARLFGSVSDPAIALTGAASSLVGGNESLSATISNDGPDPALATTATFTIPAGVDVVSATNAISGACPSTGSLVTCDLGTLAVGGSTTATIVVRRNTAGISSVVANAASQLVDDDPANSSATVSFTAVKAKTTLAVWLRSAKGRRLTCGRRASRACAVVGSTRQRFGGSETPARAIKAERAATVTFYRQVRGHWRRVKRVPVTASATGAITFNLRASSLPPGLLRARLTTAAGTAALAGSSPYLYLRVH